MLKYEHELDLETDNSPSIILRQIKAGSKVLEMGPATGYMTRYMKEHLGCNIYCIEFDKESAKQAEKYCDKMIVANLEDLQWTSELVDEKFDYIIFADVLEHLRNPEKVLEQATRFLETNGIIITSIPNVSHNAIIMELMNGNFEYRELGLLDSTHVRFFTKKSILNMITEVGLTPIKMMATVVGPEETEFKRNYEELPESLQKFLIDNIEGHIYQYITISKLEKNKDAVKIEEHIPSISNRYHYLQVYWLENEVFTEKNSEKCSIVYDNEFHSYKLEIPSFQGDVLRIDIGNWSAVLNIRSIRLLRREKDGGLQLLQEASSNNDFKDLALGENVIQIKRSDTYKLLSINKDPQIYLKVDRTVCNSDSLVIDIELSAEKGRSFYDQQAQLLSSQFQMIVEQKDIILKKDQELANLLTENKESTQKLEKAIEQLTKKNEKLTQITESLAKIEVDLTEAKRNVLEESEKNKDLIEKLRYEEMLLSELQKRYDNLMESVEKMKNSRSWKYTAPFRRAVQLMKKARKTFTNIYYILSKRKFSMKLLPMQQIKQQDNSWCSTGNDPAFLLQGDFPTGWVVMTFISSSQESVPLKMYWDSGDGMSEETSSLIGRIPVGDQKANNIIVSIPDNAVSLRLDPGEKEINFHFSNLSFRKISRFHLLFYAFKNHLKLRGGSTRTLLNVLNKSLQIYKVSGMSGVWQKTKNVLGLTTEGILGQDYQQWIELHQVTGQKMEKIIHEITNFKYKPLISIILPVYNVEEKWLRKCIDSVRNQLYPNWELCIADDFSTKKHIRPVLEEYAAKDSRIKVVFREKNGHISESSNSALQISSGEFIGLLDNDDELTIDALFENVKLLNDYPDADMIYSDEDKISIDGQRHSPFFKPDWSPDLLLTHMYTCHFGIYRSSIVKKIGGFRKGYEGSQDFDLALRFTEITDKVYHIPKILYHWRTIPESTASGPGAKNYTHYAGLRAVQDAIKRRGINGWIEELEGYSNFYRVHYRAPLEPTVSIIIPTKDNWKILSNCLNSIHNLTDYENFEIVIIDNNSIEKDTFRLFDQWKEKLGDRLKILTITAPFNYSKLNNRAVEIARGELLLFLNNDIEVLDKNWLKDMVGAATRKEIGAVGANLIYPDNTIQHSGLVLGLGAQRAAGDGHHFRPIDDPGYFGALLSVRNVSAVTGACLMVRKDIFVEVNGFDEILSVAYNDVDFCLKICQKGYRNLWLPYVKLIHFESKTRGYDSTSEKIIRLNEEAEYLKNKWGEILLNDPYYNPNLSLDVGFGLKIS
ncbi:glycosyltransferase [Paenibacillus sp. 32O-W]|uniref:glycosyltransferase n=1 Tax=Paenibacillus sp. 32O-W TaxID=1695218 RepID=UPI00119D3775|nr:glycosyltransferase [Paenibacillus sp. 32O-W]